MDSKSFFLNRYSTLHVYHKYCSILKTKNQTVSGCFPICLISQNRKEDRIMLGCDGGCFFARVILNSWLNKFYFINRTFFTSRKSPARNSTKYMPVPNKIPRSSLPFQWMTRVSSSTEVAISDKGRFQTPAPDNPE